MYALNNIKKKKFFFKVFFLGWFAPYLLSINKSENSLPFLRSRVTGVDSDTIIFKTQYCQYFFFKVVRLTFLAIRSLTRSLPYIIYDSVLDKGWKIGAQKVYF